MADGVAGEVRAAREVRGRARPLADPATWEALVERLASARVVQLGEASHGTSE